MKMNLFHWNTVDAAFCLCQQGEGSQAKVAGSLGQAGAQEKAANLRQAAAMLVLSVRIGMAVIVVMMVLMLLDRPGNGCALMQPAVDGDIDFGRLNAAPAYPGHA
jgi:hypothetical protein